MAVFSSQNASAEIALAVLAVCMAYMATGVARRRIIWLFSTVVSPVCYSLVFYILGVALSAHPSSRDDESASLACSALLLVGLANSIVSHSVPCRHRTLGVSSYHQLLQMVFVLVLVLPPWSFGHRALLWTLVGAVFMLWVGQLGARLSSASDRSRIKDDLLISQYMYSRNQHNPGNQNFDPSDFKGLDYIVGGEVSSRDSLRFLVKHVITLAMGLPRKMHLRTGACVPRAIINPVISYDTLVTVQDIWKDTHSSETQDVCLSFALFKLLRRRFHGCFLHESVDVKTTQFVLHGLLSTHSELNPLRAFHIIEAELGFVFDFFYTIPKPEYLCAIVYTALTSYALYLTLHPPSNDEGVPPKTTTVVHRLLSAVVLTFPILGFMQLISSPFSKSYRVNSVINICQRRKQRASSSQNSDTDSVLVSRYGIKIKNWAASCCGIKSYADSILLRVMGRSKIGSSWSNIAGQYCLFHGDYRGFTTRRVSNKTKEALLNALRLSDGKLSDGRSSLSGNQAQELHWACEQEFVAEKILVWHVATTLCHTGQHAKETSDNRRVATTLSDYCAYLVGFAPELVAEDIYATRLVFNNGRAAAMERLRGEGCLATMHQSAAVMDLRDRGFTNTAQQDVVFKGKILGAQLIKLEKDKRWKVLAELWAELMLFVSPSHDAAAHLERLKDGGELITHIWALLTHAGILERPSGRDNYTSANQTGVQITIMPGETTTSFPAQTEIVEAV